MQEQNKTQGKHLTKNKIQNIEQKRGGKRVKPRIRRSKIEKTKNGIKRKQKGRKEHSRTPGKTKTQTMRNDQGQN